MTTGTEREINLSTLLGLNNRSPDFRLRTKDGAFVRAAANTLISDAGTVKRRQGYAPEFAGLDCHSLWVDTATDTGFYVDASTLYRVTAAGDGLARQVIATDLARGRQLSYARVGTDVAFSDGLTIRCVGGEGVRPFGVPALQAMPSVATSAGGSLAAGLYLVSAAFANAQMELSGATPPVQVAVAQDGKLTVSNLPVVWPAGADMLVVYVSPVNSSALFAETRLHVPAASVEFTRLSGAGMQAETVTQVAMPPGRIIRHFAGRLYAADGPLLRYSEIYSPALHNPASGYVYFNAPITVVEPCDDGMFIVADVTYWLAGDIASATLKQVLPSKAVFGSAAQMPLAQQVTWMSEQGLVVGGSGGSAKLMHADNVAVPRAAAGASFVSEADGQRHIVSSLFGAPGSGAAARSFMDAEIVRKGTTL